MNRRTFNSMLTGGALTGGAMSVAGPAFPKSDAAADPQTPAASAAPAKWPEGAYRRLLVDTHVPDWDPRLLANFDPAQYVQTIAEAGFTSVMHYAKSHVGLCLWPSKIGPVHANMKGRDYFGETMKECHARGLHTVAYYSLIYDIWAFDNFADWRIIPEDGIDRRLLRRPGIVCPNSPYRDRALAELRELVGNYEFDGIFLDMTFWPEVCYCGHCTERYHHEHNAEPPRIVDWDDPAWRQFQKTRERWILEFAKVVTKTIKDVRPITVNHQFSTVLHFWKRGIPLEIRDASDYVGGDFYGGPTQYSLVCKAYYGLSRVRPFEFHTSRTTTLNDFETNKPFNELLTSCSIATLHSAANMVIDSINPDGTLNAEAYKYLAQQNARRAPYEPYLGGNMLADVAIYYDKESMYDPSENGVRVGATNNGDPAPPHLGGVVGAAKILRTAHIPYGLVTNVTLDQLSNFRAVIVPNVLEMTESQAAQFRNFVQKGGVLYASGPSSLDRFDRSGPRYLLEDVFGVRYQGIFESKWTYFSPQDAELKRSAWPQDALSFPGSMIRAQAAPGAQVLATVTLPFVDPTVGNCLNPRFAQIWNDPPALTPGSSPGIVMNSFGQGKVVWLAAPLESVDHEVTVRAVSLLLRRALPGPYHFEVDTHSSVEMTLFDQPDKRRLVATLLNMDWQLSPLRVGATVRVLLPAGKSPTQVLGLPEQKVIPSKRVGQYLEFSVDPFETLAMASVEYT